LSGSHSWSMNSKKWGHLIAIKYRLRGGRRLAPRRGATCRAAREAAGRYRELPAWRYYIVTSEWLVNGPEPPGKAAAQGRWGGGSMLWELVGIAYLRGARMTFGSAACFSAAANRQNGARGSTM